MAISNLIVRGRVGFQAGDVSFLLTHGLSIGESLPPPVVIARQGTGERRHAYDFGDDEPTPPRRIIRIPQAKKHERKPQPAITAAVRTPRPAPIPLWTEPKRDIADADFERPSRWNATQDEDELLLLGVL